MSKEVMRQALEALETSPMSRKNKDAIDALREALAEQLAQQEPYFKFRECEDSQAGQPKEPEQEPVEWRDAAIRLGEELSSVGPDGYYNMSARQWLDWSMEQKPRGKNSLPPQRTWVGLVWGELPEDGKNHDFLRGAVWAETKLKEKNTP